LSRLIINARRRKKYRSAEGLTRGKLTFALGGEAAIVRAAYGRGQFQGTWAEWPLA
jgi:hypothetical protein